MFTIPHILIYILVIIYFVCLPKIFAKAGREDATSGYIPGYNVYVWLQVIGKPWWWIFFILMFPFNVFITFLVLVAMNVETARLFGKYELKDTILTILVPWYMIPKLAFDEKEVTQDPTDWEKAKDREKRTLHDHATLFFMAPFISHALLFAFKLFGNKRKEGKGSMEYEWTNAIGFAIVAASIIRTFFFEAFTIPTGSMEKTMRIGDYLFVNKIKYGARVPMNPMSVPFVHNRIPMTFIPSYVEIFQNDYRRLPGYGKMERGQIMVFNWPVGDSVLLNNDVIAHDRYQFVRDNAFYSFATKNQSIDTDLFEKVRDKYYKAERKKLDEGGPIYAILNDGSSGVRVQSTEGLQTLHMEKKENYIKRCVAGPGDVLTINDGQISINGELQELPPEAQFQYRFWFKGNTMFTRDYLDEEFEIYNQDVTYDRNREYVDISCTPEIYEQLAAKKMVDSSIMKIEPYKESPIASKWSPVLSYCPIYPNDPSFNWSRDNFGPLEIPAKGKSMPMTKENWILYKRVIKAYEHNESAEWKDGKVYVNGEAIEEYTFKQNYYWMMGDNRHGSVDSRYWGFVGEDHIVGTASFIWMSKHPEKGWFGGGLRFGRMFSLVD